MNIKRIIGYRKLLGVNENTTLQELKTSYRNMMKNWHPDKFNDTVEQHEDAEAKSRHIIEAYHFLVSIAPETHAQYQAEYDLTTSSVGITDFEYKSEKLQINFLDGTSYEYFGVPKAVYVKFVNAPAPGRFGRRHIYNSFPYRIAGKTPAEE